MSTDHNVLLRDINIQKSLRINSDFLSYSSQVQLALGQAGGHGPCSGAAAERSRFPISQMSVQRENIISDCL